MAESFSFEDPPEYQIPAVKQRPWQTLSPTDCAPHDEYRRHQSLSRRCLQQSDIPNEPWRAGMEHYLLREDGVIEAEGLSLPLGFVQPNGTVAWTQAT